MLISELDKPSYLKWNKDNIKSVVDFCGKYGQDWLTVNGGGEGSGKSSLGLQQSFLFNPHFKISDMIWSLKQFVRDEKKYRNEKFRVMNYDEAVREMFNKESQTRANIILIKVFISNRSFQHFHIINMPSIFSLEKYLREWRVKTFNYCYFDNDPDYRLTAYFSKRKYLRMLHNPQARKYISDSEYFLKRNHPNFQERFNSINGDVWQEYVAAKEKNQCDMLDEAEEEVMKLEDNKKLGFHEKMDLPTFLSLCYHDFQVKGSKLLHLSRNEVATKYKARHEKIQSLIDALEGEGYITKFRHSQYMMTEKALSYISSNNWAGQEVTKSDVV